MKIETELKCPKCNKSSFSAKREATYVYTYKITSEDSRITNPKEALSFLFDNRDEKCSYEFIECDNCGAKYPFSFGENDLDISFTILQKAIRSLHKKDPEFYG